MEMKAIWTILLLVTSNIFMTFAWYGHLKLQEMKISSNWPLIGVILFSWAIAFFEYCAQVPANRIGFNENGGPFNLMQLKVIQEVISLTVFTVIATLLFKGQALQWNHLVAFVWVRITVSTQDSQSCNRSSILLPSTRKPLIREAFSLLSADFYNI